MDWTTALLILMGLLVLLMLTGLPVAFAFLGVNMLGAYLFLGGEIGLGQVARNAMSSMLNYSLAPIPLFILMGELMLRTGLAFSAINAIDRMIWRLPGRLPVVSVAAGTAFSALSGSSMANTAMLGSTLLPEMLRKGYHPRLSIGPILAVGGIAILIPPSALSVLLGSLARIPITSLLIAGIVPGLILAFLFTAYIVVRSVLNPSLVPAEDHSAALTGWERYWPFFRDVMPLFAIFFAVVGSLIGGFATPTESAAIGVAATLVAAILYRKFSFAALWKAIVETGKISGLILFIIVGSLTFSQILAFSGAASGMLRVVQGMDLTPIAIILFMVLILLFLGCFVDQVSMLMITVPFFIPLALASQIDVIWLGVIYLLALEIALLTPPFGLLLFVMKGVAPREISLGEIIRSAVPFLGIHFFVLALIILFPVLSTWLPSTILGR